MNNKIHLIMPMGGGGTRFGNKGFNVPKPLIMLQGHPFFYWAVQSIINYVDVADVTFVVLKEHIENFDIDESIHYYYPSAYIKVIPQVLDGAVLTCMEGLSYVKDSLPILFNDCDHAFISKDFYTYCKKGNFNDIDGALLTFNSDNPNYSYIKFNDDMRVVGTIEKVVASNEAICGAYYFKNADIFKNSVDNYLSNCSYSEYYVSGVYNEMVKKNMTIVTFKTDEHISFGTPMEYDHAIYDERLGKLL